MAKDEDVVKANEAFKRIIDELWLRCEAIEGPIVRDIRLVGKFIENQLEFTERENNV